MTHVAFQVLQCRSDILDLCHLGWKIKVFMIILSSSLTAQIVVSLTTMDQVQQSPIESTAKGVDN